MRILLVCALVSCLVGTAWGQASPALPVDKATHRISYRALVPVTGVSQPTLVARAHAWAKGHGAVEKPVTSRPEQPQDMLVTASRAQPFVYTFPLLERSATTPAHQTYRHILHYHVTLSLQEGRYAYELTDFVFEYPGARVKALSAEEAMIGIIPLSEQGALINTTRRAKFDQLMLAVVATLQEQMNRPTPGGE
jgi:hypothetical protein